MAEQQADFTKLDPAEARRLHAEFTDELRAIREQRQRLADVVGLAQRNMADFRAKAKEQRIPNRIAQETALRHDLDRALQNLRALNTRVRWLSTAREQLRQQVRSGDDFRDWPITQLVREAARLAARQKLILGRIGELLAQVEARDEVLEADFQRRVRAAQANGSSPEIGTLQPPPRRTIGAR